MSGGSFEYIYNRLNDAAEYTSDKEIKDLLRDLAELLHDEEWYESGDYSKDNYVKTLISFKEKWFNSSREERLKTYIDSEIEKTRENLYQLVGIR